MIESISFHELAESELNEAAAYYESQVGGLGIASLAEVEHATSLIRLNPESSPRILKVIRRKILRRFPYNILYSVVGNSVRIVAIANQKRRPYYWLGRR